MSATGVGRHQRGQMLIVFALALVGIVSMSGLIIDGGSAFAQRRSQQNAADLAALAAANDYLIGGDSSSAQATAWAASARNGYTDGTNGTTVAYSLSTDVGASIRVTVSEPHRNAFLSIVGMSSWQVSASARVLTGYPDTAYGAAPMIFSIRAFGSDGKPAALYSSPSSPYAFGDGNGDVPNDAGDIAWTNYGTGNVDTSQVRSIINGTLVIDKTLQYGTYIGQHNNGNHSALFDDVDQYLSGKDLAVPVVDDGGNFQGWATFHVVSASGGSSKTVTGYFEKDFTNAELSTTACSSGSCPRYLGSYVLKLVD